MVGINFADTIVVRRTSERCTKIVDEPVKPSAWSGQEFKDTEEKRLALAGDLMIMSAKGTKKIRLSEMTKTKIPDTKGHYIITGKGTGKIKL